MKIFSFFIFILIINLSFHCTSSLPKLKSKFQTTFPFSLKNKLINFKKSINVNKNETDQYIQNKNMNVYVLNLDRDAKRWNEVSKELDREGVIAQRFSAVDGLKLNFEELKNNTTFLSRMFQPRGVIGCYLSHRKFWQMVVDQNLEAAIILEDDIKLTQNFLSKLEGMWTEIEAAMPFDILLLGAIGRVHPESKDTLGPRLFSLYMGGNRPLKRISSSLYEPRRPAGTHAYLITQEGAQKLLNLCSKAVSHVDLDAWRQPSLKIIMVDPMLVYQSFNDSTISIKKDRTNLLYKLIPKKILNKVDNWATDPYTKQPWSHALSEPLLQLGPEGPLLTLERHCTILAAGGILSSLLRYQGDHYTSNIIMKGLLFFGFSVRSLLWVLMNWK